eukprot:m.813219 g.813219  ORF g.813219 m.813219 type:complete len:89 (+) comp59357_c0_seq15:206-472(+)
MDSRLRNVLRLLCLTWADWTRSSLRLLPTRRQITQKELSTRACRPAWLLTPPHALGSKGSNKMAEISHDCSYFPGLEGALVACLFFRF